MNFILASDKRMHNTQTAEKSQTVEQIHTLNQINYLSKNPQAVATLRLDSFSA